MPLSGSCFWAAILPVQKTNLYANPSGERGTFGWTDVNCESIGTESFYQQFGAWSIDIVTDNAQNQSAAGGGTWASGNGTAYTASAYLRVASGKRVRMAVGTANNSLSGASVAGSVIIDGGGTWHRYNIPYTETADQNRRLLVWGSDYGQDHIYVDGVQVEVGSLTTLIDGDQDGCYWTGLPHQSQSVRSGTYRGGGSVVALEDLGLKPYQFPGVGMPPQEITAQSYALQPGAEYQRSRAGGRPFSITFQPILGTTQKGFHAVRRRLIDAFKPDLLDPQQPVRFWYTGAGGTIQIDAVYAGGLDFGDLNGPMAEKGAVRFVAHDPYWYSTTQQGTALAPRTAIGSANAIARRDPLGRWGTMGAHGTSVAGTVDCLLMAPTGTLFVGGRVTTFDGTANSRGLAMYFPSTNRYGTMVGTLTPGALYGPYAMLYAPWGSLYIAGDFTLVNGTSTRFLAQWNGAYGSLIGGTLNGRVYDIELSASGTLFAGGSYQTANGTTAPNLAMWMPAGSWGTLVGQGAGTVDEQVLALAFGLDRTLYFTGRFGSAGGTAMNKIGQWKNGTFGTMGSGLQWSGISGTQGNALTVGANGVLTVGGFFGTAGGVRGTHVAQWNGVSYTIPGGGLGTSELNQVWALASRPADGNIYATGLFTWNSNNIPMPDGIAYFNGYTWIPLDIDTPTKVSTGGIVNAIAFGPDSSIYIGGQWVGTANAAAVAEIINTGIGEAYPIFKARNMGAGTARIYQLVNTLTGDGLYFNYAMLPGEEIILTTEPGARSFTSSFFGNVFGNILPGSNISSFRLMPGTNYVSLFCDSGSVVSSFYWTPRSDSIDGGTVY